MVVLLIIPLLIIAGVSFPAIAFTKKYVNLSEWDFIYPFCGIPLWFALVMSGVGALLQESNYVIEILLITAVSAIIPWLALLLYKGKTNIGATTAKVLTLLPILFTIALRLLIKSIPE